MTDVNNRYKNSTILKEKYSIKYLRFSLGFMILFFIFWLIAEISGCEQNRFEEIRKNRIPICQENEVSIEIKNYSTYNGINDLNSKYNIQVYRLIPIGLNEMKYQFENIYEKGDSLIKVKNNDTFLLRQKARTVKYKGDFYEECKQKE